MTTRRNFLRAGALAATGIAAWFGAPQDLAAMATETSSMVTVTLGRPGVPRHESLRFSIDDSSVDKQTWGRIPRTFVKFTLDLATPVPLQNRFITDADALTPHNRFAVHEPAVSHLGFVLDPNPLADILTSSLP
jgi:hypothetical protein